MNRKYEIIDDKVHVFDEDGNETIRDNSCNIEKILSIENDIEFLKKFFEEEKLRYQELKTQKKKEKVVSFYWGSIIIMLLTLFANLFLINFLTAIIFFIAAIISLEILANIDFQDDSKIETIRINLNVLDDYIKRFEKQLSKLKENKAVNINKDKGFIPDNIILRRKLNDIKRLIIHYQELEFRKLQAIEDSYYYEDLPAEKRLLLKKISNLDQKSRKKR